MDEIEGKLESCRGFLSDAVPDLVDQVKQSLHNPDSFEHVETTFLPVVGRNTSMEFRAENGFGAIRKGSISATLDPETCKVTSLGEFTGM